MTTHRALLRNQPFVPSLPTEPALSAAKGEGKGGEDYAAFGVSPPPTCGSVCVRNGPTTL